jgi:hypothetical protein
MCRYFAHLREGISPEGPIILFLDCYSAPHCPLVRTAVQRWGIDRVFIQPGCTDFLQPLDRRVFGVLKSYARQLWRSPYHRSDSGKTTRAMMAKNLLEAWERITPGVADNAWDCFKVNWTEDLFDSSSVEELKMNIDPKSKHPFAEE